MKKLIIILITIFLLAGCQTNNTLEEPQKSIWDVEDSEADSLETIELTIEGIQKKANEERRENQLNRYDASYGSTATEDAYALSYNDFQRIKFADSDYSNEGNNTKLTIEQAKDDARIYADIIKSSYGSYYLYDQSQWEKAYQDSIDNLDKLNKDSLTGSELANALINSYLFVNDDHFRINGKSVLEANGGLLYYFYCKEFDFLKDSRGFFTTIEDKKWYVTKINGDDNIDAYLRPTIAVTGQLVYQIGTFMHEKDDNKLELSFSRGGITNTYSTKYIKSKSLNEKGGGLPSTQANIIDDYYVLGIRSFYTHNGKLDKELYKYAEQAKKLKGTSNFIIDTRGNGGGGDIYLSDFYTNYTGVNCQLNISRTVRYSYLTSSYSNYFGTKVEKQDGSYADNKNLFVYLIDKDVASSGERGVLSIKQMDNALLVGTNSRGCIIGGGRYLYLPNSKIIVSVCDAAFIEGNCTSEIEGLGWMPDIFVDGYLALDRAIKMYKYYGLLPDDNVSNLDMWGGKIETFEVENTYEKKTLSVQVCDIIVKSGQQIGDVNNAGALIVRYGDELLNGNYTVSFDTQGIDYKIEGSNLFIKVPNDIDEAVMTINYNGEEYTFNYVNMNKRASSSISVQVYENEVFDGERIGGVKKDTVIVKYNGEPLEDTYEVSFDNEAIKCTINGSKLKLNIPDDVNQATMTISYKGEDYSFNYIYQ